MPTTEFTDVPAIVATALVGALVGLHVAIYLASAVVLPGTSPIDGVISWLSITGNVVTKSRELGVYSFAVILGPIGAWSGGRIAARILRRDPDAGIALAPISIALCLAAVELTWMRSGGVASATAASTAVLLAGCLACFALVASKTRVLATTVLGSRIGDACTTIPTLLCAVLPTAVFLLAVGPRIAHDTALTHGVARIATLGLGLALIAIGMSAVFASRLRPPTRHPTRPMRDPSRILWPLVFLMGARFAPDDSRVVGCAVGAAIVGVGIEFLRDRIAKGSAESSREDARNPWRRIDRVLLPAIVIVLVFHTNVDGDIDFFHEGETLTPAFAVLRGEVPFVDVYLQHGLGRNVLRTLAAFGWGEVSLAAERWSRNLAIALTHAAAFGLMIAAFRSRCFALLVALMMGTPELALDWRFLFPLLAMTCIARDVHSPDRRHAFVAGLCGAIAFFVSTDLGIYTLVSIAIFLVFDGAPGDGVANRFSRLRRFAIGAVAGASPFVFTLIGWGAFESALSNFRDQLRLQLSVWALPWTPLRDVLTGREALPDGSIAPIVASPTLLALAAAVLYLSIPTWRLIVGFARTATPTARTLTLLAIAGVVTFRTALGRSDVGHLRFASIYAIFLASGLAITAFRAAWNSRLPGSLRVGFGVAPGALLLLYASSAYVPLYTLVVQWTRISAPSPARGFGADLAAPPLPFLGDVLIPIDQARALATLDALLCEQIAPEQTFYEFSNIGATYMLLGRPSPTRYFMPVYAATSEMQDRVIADIENVRPPLAFVATGFGDSRIDGFHANARAPRLAAYLERTYDEPRFVGVGYLARRRLESPAETPPHEDSAPPTEDARDR